MGKIIALTGASGAMGGEALRQILESDGDYRVRVLLHSARRPAFLRDTLRRYGDRIEIVTGSVEQLTDCKKLVDGASYVLHVAALIPPRADHMPDKAMEVNAGGTENMVRAVLESGRAEEIGFVHISSMSVYGCRAARHIYARVGDPVISSALDYYSASKIRAERAVLESGLPKWVILRQTAVLHKYLMKNNLSDGLMFHTIWNSGFEWVTDRDSGLMLRHLAERDDRGEISELWNRVWNIGGGESCRETGFETINDGFRLMGRSAKAFFRPNYNLPREFHGVWFSDSDELNDLLDFRREDIPLFWRRMRRRIWYAWLGKLIPPSLLARIVVHPLLRASNSPVNWVREGNEERIRAYYGDMDGYLAIPSDWEDYPLLCEAAGYEAMKSAGADPGYRLDHGYDESVAEDALSAPDFTRAAEFRGGALLNPEEAGGLDKPLLWRCAFGHEFTARPYTVLKAGLWCPECDPPDWKYGAIAARAPFYGQVWYDTHSPAPEDPAGQNPDAQQTAEGRRD